MNYVLDPFSKNSTRSKFKPIALKTEKDIHSLPIYISGLTLQLIPDHQTHLLRKGPNLSSETGFGGNFLASLDAIDEFHHLSNLIFWWDEELHVAIICNFSRVISRTSFEVQCLSISVIIAKMLFPNIL